MDYDGLVTALSDLLTIPADNADFQTILPSIISDAEGRIYREMDFLATRTVDTSSPVVTGSRSFTLPSEIIILQNLSVISPAGATLANGTIYPVQMVSLDYLTFVWTSQTGEGSGIPAYGARIDENTIALAPVPNAAYTAVVQGIFRPDPISETNTTTYISLNYPDLLLAACMVFASGYQRDFGAQADDPKMAQSWEALYQSRAQSTFAEEQRRKGFAAAWSPYQPAPLATPPRK